MFRAIYYRYDAGDNWHYYTGCSQPPHDEGFAMGRARTILGTFLSNYPDAEVAMKEYEIPTGAPTTIEFWKLAALPFKVVKVKGGK